MEADAALTGGLSIVTTSTPSSIRPEISGEKTLLVA